MSEPGSLYRLSVLEERWRSDRSPRVFLQLADELRRAGRTDRAIEVLRDGLAWRPESVSGWVALGRILLDEDDPRAAIAALEQAIERDPTQLVANRLLTEAWIRVGDAERAKASLERSRLLSLPDEDYEALEAGIRDLDAAPSAARQQPVGETMAPPQREEPFALAAPAELPEIDLRGAVPSRRGWVRVEVGQAPFDQLLGGAGQLPAILESGLRREGIFDVRAVGAVVPDEASAVAAARPPEALEVTSAEPPREAPELALEVSGPAAIEPTQVASSPFGEADEEAAAESSVAVLQEPLEPVFEPLSIGEEVERETVEAAPEAPVEDEGEEVEDLALATPPTSTAAAPAATTTLASLYLAQGHLEEAEVEFRRVLADRPDDPEALAGLRTVRERRGESAAAGVSHDEALPLSGGLTARKLSLLRGLYERLRAQRLGGAAGVP